MTLLNSVAAPLLILSRPAPLSTASSFNAKIAMTYSGGEIIRTVSPGGMRNAISQETKHHRKKDGFAVERHHRSLADPRCRLLEL